MANGKAINFRSSATGHAFHMSDARVRCIAGPVGCLPCDTEVMTDRGWIRIDQWNGEAILQFDKDNQNLAFTKPKRYIKAPCSTGFRAYELLGVRNEDNPVMMVTPNHRILTVVDGEYVVMTADEISSRFGTMMTFFIPSCGGLVCVRNSTATFDATDDGRDGMQYCFETDTGFFVVRQGGVEFITGNSGKSSECIFAEPLKRVREQEADPEGRRRIRVAMVRNTYQQLESTTLKTFQDWWGFDIAHYKNGKTMEATVKFPLGDGTKAVIEVVFLALDKPDDIGKIRSLELTMAYVNEGSEIADYAIVDALGERIGRYPKQWGTPDEPKGGCTWCGIIIDTNAPDDEHWIYQKFEVEKPDGFEIFHQPPAVLMGEGGDPENPMWVPNKGQFPGIRPAENIEHLGKAGHGWDYYMKMIPGKEYDVVRVMLQGYYGTVAYGKKVYPEWNDQVYYLPNKKDEHGKEMDVLPMRGLPILVGIDFGIQWSAAVFAQLSQVRQLRVLEELVLQDESTQNFAMRVRSILQTRYIGMKVQAYGDPCAKSRDRQTGITDIALLNQFGIPTIAGPTNDPKKRRDAVVWFMQRLVGKGEPGLILSSHCQMLRKGFNGRYYYKRVSASAREQIYKADPVKNEFSHPHDALQYIATSLLYESGQASFATTSMAYANEFGFGGGINRAVPSRFISLGGF